MSPNNESPSAVALSPSLLAMPLLVGAAALAVGCADQSPLGPRDGVHSLGSAQASMSEAIDVSGEWQWNRSELIRMPRWFVENVLNGVPGNDVQPEGRNTHARCHSEGIMMLVQDGATFEGSASRTAGSCQTFGGQVFQQPDAALPLAVFDGRIRGLGLSFSMGNPVVSPCPHNTVITDVEGGMAVAFGGTARCVLPGHPQSESILPLGPPPGGTSKTLSFGARRD